MGGAGFLQLRAFNFRNLEDTELSLEAREVFLVGENGQGKTNLIEAVYLLCFGSSFREKRESALMRDTQASMAISGVLCGQDSTQKRISLELSPGHKKEIRVEEKLLMDRRDLLSQVLCVCFVQQDMDFVCGPPDARRRFFDQTLVLSDLSYLDSLRRYRQILRSRNLSLRSSAAGLLDVYDSQLAEAGLDIQARRASLVRDFNAAFSPLFREVSGIDQDIEILDTPSWHGLHSPHEVLSRLSAFPQRDAAFGVTTSGPHRDSFSFDMAGRDYAHFASTGQLRLCALALRVAQARFLAGVTGRKPILLLDDVLLELDPGRRKAFIERFPPYEQAFFTFLPDENYRSFMGSQTLILHVENGGFRPCHGGDGSR